jgi:hypothetical protein
MATFDHRPGQPPIASGIFTANWHEADEGATFDPLNALGDRVHVGAGDAQQRLSRPDHRPRIDDQYPTPTGGPRPKPNSPPAQPVTAAPRDLVIT